MMISKDKTYTTRDGREVRIYATDAGGEHPIHGAYRDDGVWKCTNWLANGSFDSDGLCRGYDLIEAPVTRQMWVNVYEDESLPRILHPTKEAANTLCNINHERIACVPVTITYRPGEGL